MKKLHVILNLYELESKVNSLTPYVNILLQVMKEHPEIASIETCKVLHLTAEDIVNLLSEDVNNIISMIAMGTVREY